MSNNSHDVSPSDSNPKLVAVGAARLGGVVLAITAVVVGALVAVAVLQSPPEPANPNMTEEAVGRRIEKIGVVTLRLAASGVLRSGEEVYKASCSACHDSGALGAPKFADKAAWAPRIATGFAALLNSALKGKNAMPAQAGGDYAETEVARALVYMTNAGGASFPEPAAPAQPAASAASK